MEGIHGETYCKLSVAEACMHVSTGLHDLCRIKKILFSLSCACFAQSVVDMLHVRCRSRNAGPLQGKYYSLAALLSGEFHYCLRAASRKTSCCAHADVGDRECVLHQFQ